MAKITMTVNSNSNVATQAHCTALEDNFMKTKGITDRTIITDGLCGISQAGGTNLAQGELSISLTVQPERQC